MRRSSQILVAFVLLIGGASCKESERHFVPAPPPQRDAAAAPEPGAPATGDGGAATAGAASGGGGYPADAELSKAEADDLLAFLDTGVPPDLDDARLFTKLARKCGSTASCVAPECGKVLAVCDGADRTGCGTMLLERCPPFQTIAQGASGDDLGARTNQWVKDLWGDLVVKLRLSLPDKLQGKLDKLAQRHGL